MSERKQGRIQASAAAKAGVSERSARRIDSGDLTTEPTPKRHWRTRKDPLADVWDSVLVPMLEKNPGLLPSTLFEHLCDNYPGHYDNTIQCTLQRRVKAWKAKHGPAKEVMFHQTKEPARLALTLHDSKALPSHCWVKPSATYCITIVQPSAVGAM